MAPMETKAEAQSKGKSVKDERDEEKEEEEEVQERFSPEEEASLLAESNATKTEANALFASAKYDAAIAKYDEAAASCPNYLDYELAVLRSNISACHLKLEQWKDAISSATAALDGLDRLDRQAALDDDSENQQRREKEEEKVAAAAAAAEKARAAAKKEEEEEEGVEAEIITPGARKAAPVAAASAAAASNDEDESAAAAKKEAEEEEQARRESSSSRADDVLRIRAKALMRRARARSEEGGWQNLAGAEEDYRTLAGMKNLAPGDRRIVDAQLRALPPRTKAAQEKETAEMWGKLKDLGNGILKPFGLSTDNFQMVKDEKTGGYSMNFTQGQGK